MTKLQVTSSGTIDIHGTEQLRSLAGNLANQLKPGDIVALDGALGSGKTTLVRLLVQALGGDASQVASPTFVLLHVYDTPTMCVFHVDAYRIESQALDGIGFDELLQENGLILIEWASRVRERLPTSTINVSMLTTGPDSRRVTISWPTAPAGEGESPAASRPPG